MAQEPFRLRVVKALCQVFEGITVANGYNFDMEGRVFRGRLFFGDNDPIPMISVLEAPLPDEPNFTPPSGDTWTGTWRFMIQGWVTDDPKNPTDPAHFLLADVKKALAIERKNMIRPGRGNNLLGMEGRVLDLVIGANVVRPAEEHVNDYANFLLALTLEIAENMADPYQ
jgi:hypothetical protein